MNKNEYRKQENDYDSMMERNHDDEVNEDIKRLIAELDENYQHNIALMYRLNELTSNSFTNAFSDLSISADEFYEVIKSERR